MVPAAQCALMVDVSSSGQRPRTWTVVSAHEYPGSGRGTGRDRALNGPDFQGLDDASVRLSVPDVVASPRPVDG